MMNDEKTVSEITAEQIIGILKQTVCEVIPTVSGIAVNVAESFPQNSGYAAAMLISGGINCLLLLTAGKDSLLTLASNMTGIEAEAIADEDLLDCASELLNMFCGSIKAQIARQGSAISFTTPFSVKGENGLYFHFKRNSKVFLASFSSGEINFDVKLIVT